MHFLGEGLRECVSAPHPEARYSCYFPAYVLGTLIPNDSFFPLQGRVSCFFFIARASLRSVLKKLAPPLIRKGIVLSIILSIHPVYPSCLSSCLSCISSCLSILPCEVHAFTPRWPEGASWLGEDMMGRACRVGMVARTRYSFSTHHDWLGRSQAPLVIW